MAFKRLITLLVAVMFILPTFITADDFEDDFGGGGGDDFAEDDFGSFEEEKKEEEPFDAEESAEKKEKEDQKKSDEAMRDLLGEEEEEPREKEEAKKEEKKEEDFDAIEPVDVDPKEEVKSGAKGFKPVLLVKGGFTLLGQYRQKDATGVKRTLGSMFGSVDEGLLGAEFEGKYVIAKGTMNIRTDNPLINKSSNPLMAMNLHSIQNGIANGLYELYGGMKFFGVFVKAGKMVPEYGLVGTYQKLGMGFSTPFLTRSLLAVEGFIPETDAGFALGYENTFAKAHTIHVGLMLGTGSSNSQFWNSDKTMGLYAKLAYMHKIFQFGFGLQYRKDYYNAGGVAKELPFIGIGIHANVSVKGFEMPLTFDFNQISMVSTTTGVAKKSAQNILLSLAPGYAYSFKSNWADKIALAVRFDLARGVYIAGTDYQDYATFKNTGMYFRIGATLNFFVKEVYGVGSYAGITFLMQPESEVASKNSITGQIIDYGFTTLMLSAGAEF